MTTQLNENNMLINKETILEMFKKLNISNFQINDLANYQQAFVHRSYIRKQVQNSTPEESNLIQFQLESNEVLEFEGDSILGSYVARYLHYRYPEEQEGFLTTLKSRLVKTESLAKFAEFLGFGKWLIISKYVEEQGGRQNPKLLENTFEAFIGAVYRDNGGFRLDPCSLLLPHKIIRNIMELTINFGTLNKEDDNFKDQLMRAFHKHFKGRHATYTLIKTEGQSNNCIFTCGVLHPLYPNVIVSQANGRKKPQAEQGAAKIALEKLDWIINYQGETIPPLTPSSMAHRETISQRQHFYGHGGTPTSIKVKTTSENLFSKHKETLSKRETQHMYHKCYESDIDENEERYFD